MDKKQWQRKKEMDRKPREVRYLRKMPPAGMPPYCKQALGKTSGDSGPYRSNPKKAAAVERGRRKIEAFIMRALKLNQPRRFMRIRKSRLGVAIRNAIGNT